MFTENDLVLLNRTIFARNKKFRVKFKDKSFFMKFLGVLLFFNKRFMTGYITTIGNTVYFPSEERYRKYPDNSFSILAHEYVHLCDGGFWFSLSFLMPQIFTVFALAAFGAFYNLWFLLALAALVFALPIPAYWRMKWELRGYAMAMALDIWENGIVSESKKESLSARFTGPDYYFMWPFRKSIMARLNELEKAIHNGNILSTNPAFNDVRKIVVCRD
jgi:hypothetical protein